MERLGIILQSWPAGTDWIFVSSGSIDLKAYLGSKVKIAFVYTSKDGESGSWEIKDVLVKAEGTTEPVEPTPEPEEPIEGGVTVSAEKDYLAANITGVLDDVISYENTSDYGGNAVTELRVYKGQSLTVTAKKDILYAK